MYILGLNAYHGDSAAALLKDGKLVAATEEERLRRVKHWAGLPVKAVQFCLEKEGLSIADIDHITVSRDPSANFYKKVLYALKNFVKIKSIIDRLLNTKKIKSLKASLAEGLGISEEQIRAGIHNIEHHRSHMASAFFGSDFEEAAVLSVDGFGDFSSTMVGTGRGKQLQVLDTVTYPHSIGIFYTAFTQWLGFSKYGDEYKVMGLAPYGEPELREQIYDVIQPLDNGLFALNLKYFSHAKQGVSMNWENGAPHIDPLYSDYFIKKFGPLRTKDGELSSYHKNIAASVQRVTEEIIFHILNHLQSKTGLTNICIAGGVAQNSVANGKIKLHTPFKNIYIPSAGHDAGTSIGSAQYLYHHILGNDRINAARSAYLGSSYSDEQIEKFLQNKNVEYQKYPEDKTVEITAEYLAEGKVVGWFQGEAEFGPRALGNRSVLVDPGREDAKDLLNAKIKKRESFRPFAPSILRESVGEYFEQEDDVLFMEKVFQIKASKRKVLPAVTHVDGSGRLQSVHQDISPKYYALIRRFGEHRGYPVLLNTSFNENEPIVNTPEEAYNCYARTEMDVLVLGNCVISRC